MTGAARRGIAVAALGVLLRAELWLPLAAALGLLAVLARRRWLHERHGLPAQVALVALAHGAPSADRPADALIAAVAPARDLQQVIERAAAQLRLRRHDEWAAGSEQLELTCHAADALPGRRAVGRRRILSLSVAVGALALLLRLHPGVFVGAFIATLVAATDLREERHWRPATLAARAVRGRQHDELGEALSLPARLALLGGSRPVLERARRLVTRAHVPAQQLDRAHSAIEEALLSFPLIGRPWHAAVLRHLPEVTAAAFVLWMPL